MRPIRLDPEETAETPAGLATIILKATDAQAAEKEIRAAESQADFLISTDALNFHRVEWRCREEWGTAPQIIFERVKMAICKKRKYDEEEFEAALYATKHRPRLPYGWTAMDLAVHRLSGRPVRFFNSEIEQSRYARGILSLAVHLQEIQKEEPILLPVEQVRAILAAKKVVVAGTIMKLVEMGLLEMTKSTYNTGSAREFRFRGIEGKDFVFEKEQ